MSGGAVFGWFLFIMLAISWLMIMANNDPMSNKWESECFAANQFVYEKCILDDGKNCLAKRDVKDSECQRKAAEMTRKALKEQSMWERHANPERWNHD